MYPYIRFNLEGRQIIYLQLIRVLPRFTRIIRLLPTLSIFYCLVNLSLAFRPSFVRSGSVRSCPRQLPPHLEMTLVYCSRDFSTLRSLYPRQYWSLTTEGGAARNSYKCKYIFCCVILVLLCLLLSPVLAFLYHLFPFSFVRRSSSSSSVCLFVLV